MRYIAWRKNVDVTPGKDLELTDWAALGRFTDEFVKHTFAV